MTFLAPTGFTLVGLLGTGSVAVVARVRRGDEELACKRLLPHHRDAAAARLALVREARCLELARHPSLPALRGVGSDEAGPFVLESVVEGASLRALKAAWSGRIPRRLALHVAVEAVRTLTAIHALEDELGAVGVVHGDIGPDNLWLGPHGAVSLLDLGSSRFRGWEAEASVDDRGTVPYAAPEIARGEHPPSQGSDVYALAATVAWLLLDGEAPLARAASEAALLAEIGERGIDLLTLESLAEPLREALRSHLAFDPGSRTSDLQVLARALDQLP